MISVNSVKDITLIREHITMKPLPSLDILNSYLSYDPITGLLTWIKVSSKAVPLGAVAGRITSAGHIQIMLLNEAYQAHRICWKMYYGEDPINEIDHKNRIKTDNHITNLRLATHIQNMRNKGTRVDNELGYKGISIRESGRYRARIFANGKHINIGTFDTLLEAVIAHEQKMKEIFNEFTPN